MSMVAGRRSREQHGPCLGFRVCTRASDRISPRFPTTTETVHPASATVQPPISPIPCRTLNKLIPPVLFSPVLIYTELRGASSHPRSASSPLPLRALCDLCVKIPPPRDLYRSAPPKTSTRSSPASPLQIAKICTFLHQNPNSPLLFSTPCALFCNYEGVGGGVPKRCHPDRREGSVFSRFPLCYLLSFHILPNSFACRKNTTPLFSDVSKLFKEKHPGGGRGPILVSAISSFRSSILSFCSSHHSSLTTRHSFTPTWSGPLPPSQSPLTGLQSPTMLSSSPQGGVSNVSEQSHPRRPSRPRS
jgi:hypothetical protein